MTAANTEPPVQVQFVDYELECVAPQKRESPPMCFNTLVAKEVLSYYEHIPELVSHIAAETAPAVIMQGCYVAKH